MTLAPVRDVHEVHIRILGVDGYRGGLSSIYIGVAELPCGHFHACVWPSDHFDAGRAHFAAHGPARRSLLRAQHDAARIAAWVSNRPVARATIRALAATDD